ncbi:hypothetical protein BDR04DRAFT_385392 [Suillus decipiens]|nr:hypothetical protein BDR04DRAFT_385392 [Suillus decipiens]
MHPPSFQTLPTSSPFSDGPPPRPSTNKSVPGSRSHYSSSTTAVGPQSGITTKALVHSCSLSVSLAQEKEKYSNKHRRVAGSGTSTCANPLNQYVSCMEREISVDKCDTHRQTRRYLLQPLSTSIPNPTLC